MKDFLKPIFPLKNKGSFFMRNMFLNKLKQTVVHNM